MFSLGTPTDSTPLIISRTISGEEQQAGAPDGLILIPTMSLGATNLAHAARIELSPVSSRMPRSIIRAITGCDTRLPTIASGENNSTTRPGNRPGIPSLDDLASGRPCTSTGGTGGKTTSAAA